MFKLLETTVGQVLRDQAEKNGNKEFLVFPGHDIRYTFHDVNRQADALAKGLLAAGFKKGDHIGIWAHNVPRWAFVFYAASRVGIVIVPINVNCRHKEISYILSQADIKGLFFIDTYRDTDLTEILYQIIPELKNSSAGKLDSAQFPFLKMVAILSDAAYAGMYTLDDLVQTGKITNNVTLQKAESEVSNTDTLTIMYTSGTTGFPKGAMLTHRNMINSVYLAFQRGSVPGETEIIFNPLPFFYITALSGCLLGGILFGHKIVGVELFDPTFSLDVIQNEKCTRIFGVPAVFLALMGHPKYKDFDLQNVKYASIGGTSCPAELLKNIFVTMNLKSMHHLYGMTETSPFITDIHILNPSDPNLSTVGCPLPGVEISIRDMQNNKCPVSTEGEICVKGHGIMQGYYKMEDATRQTIDSKGWLHTGDLGFLTDDGYLVLGGRLKELIISNGLNIYPKEIENVLLTMPCVHDAQVVGIPSEKYGEEVCAFIILKAGTSATDQDVKNFCKNNISSFKKPRHVFFTDSFPLSGNGKVQKFKLSQMALIMLKENKQHAF